MSVTDSEIRAKGRAVRDKAVEVWMKKHFYPLVAHGAPMGTDPAGIGYPNPDYYREEVEAQVREAFDFIETMFDSHAQRNPAGLEATRTHLEGMSKTMAEPFIGRVTPLISQLSDWRGTAAENFFDDFLAPLEEITANQVSLAYMLDGTLDAVATMLRNGRQDIMNIGDAALNALEAVDASGGGGGGLSLGLTVVGAVFGVLAAIPTGGASATVTFAIISGASQIGASVAANSGDGTTIAGESVEDVVNQLVAASNALWETRNAVEQDIAETLQRDLADVQGRPHKYQPPVADITAFGRSDERSLEILADFQPPP